MKRILICCLSLCVLIASVSGCKKKGESSDTTASALIASGDAIQSDISTESMDFDLTDRDKDASYDTSKADVIANDVDIVNIDKEGTFVVSGTHSCIVIDVKDSEKVQVVLQNATIGSSDGPAIYIKQADKVFLTIDKDTKNIISDTTNYTNAYTDANVDGAIFSKSDLTINGTGSLTVDGNYKCGIVSKDDLVIADSSINVTSVGASIEGKDCVKLSGASVTTNSGTDAIKSTNSEDSGRGFVCIDSGTYNITSTNDAIQAVSAVNITGGTFTLTTGGGSENASTSSKDWGSWGNKQSQSTTTETKASAKAIKSSSLIRISGGEYTIDSSDDAIHSNADVEINDGTFTINSGDDGCHADDQMIINGGNINIEKSYEGLEGTSVNITGGTTSVTSSDDGVNAAGGNDSSSMGGRPGENSFNSDSSAMINITGGYTVVNATGDGLDANGMITISGGIVLVSGPKNDGNGALDYDTSATISGGIAVITGSTGMAQTFGDSSSQASIMYNLTSSVEEGKSVAITDSDGTVIASFTPEKQFKSIVVSAPALKEDSKYNIVIGGTVSDCDANGFASSGTVTDGEKTLDVTVSSKSTVYGTVGHGGMGGGPR